jgi:hypothetical protein
MGLALAVIAVMILFSTYFVQVSVVQPSLLNNETDGIALITQFNPHGIFIAMEEAGYILMNLSFLFLVPVFEGKGKLAKSIRVIFIAFFVLALLSFILVSVKHGVMREYIYEVIIISIVYLELIIAPILLAVYFKYDINKYTLTSNTSFCLETAIHSNPCRKNYLQPAAISVVITNSSSYRAHYFYDT